VNSDQYQWLKDVSEAANKAGHVFPIMAACEAALESGYGESKLAQEGKNLFGMKQHQNAQYETLSLPTKEFLDGGWKVVQAQWVSYPNLEACFMDRMATLKRLSDRYPFYARALMAPTPQVYIDNVSRTWSTDPERGEKVLKIYTDFLEMANPAPSVADLSASDN
jgi:flagellum-specific peptidoglycan hydrolase FlgJ